ncbi:MAG TPA: aryl-sulfate sulfotransferase [Bacteroidia bacterium]|nr:aryl-sulfate sulfotransferase [Bacteroidia bacterium]
MILVSNNKVQAQNYPSYTITAYSPASTGYYFVCPIRVGANPNGILPTHMILDSIGDVIYYKPFPNILNTGDFKINQNGNITYSQDGKYYVMDSTFVVVDSVETPSGFTYDGHDIQLLPNGHILLLATEVIQMDLSSYNLFGPNHTNPGNASANVTCGIVLELDQNKNIVFEWHAKDYYAFDDIDISFCNNPNNVDWTHYNAVEMDSDSNLLVSSRHFSEITKINRTTGAIMWRLGGNANQFNFVNDPAMFRRQHDIRKVSNGNYSLFDNGDGNISIPYHTAIGKEYELDENLLTANLVWSYENNPASHSLAMGSFDRSPNGISILGYGINRLGSEIFTAVDEIGNKVLEISFDDTLWSYRSFHYDTLPWNLNRPVITCVFDNGQYYLDAGAGYANYLWSDGSSTQTIPVATLDTFWVFVPKGNGGFIRSEKFIVDDLSDPCGTVSVSEFNNREFKLFPNPVNETLHIDFEKTYSGTIKIEDVTGKTVILFESENTSKIAIPTNSLSSGLYLVHFGGRVKKFVKM